MSTIYASFNDLGMAQKAIGALLDQGARKEDLSLIANHVSGDWRLAPGQSTIAKAEVDAKTGITTTTAEDAAVGAEKGALVGIGVGVLAALACLTVPGVGLVFGGGALAAAVAAAAATTAAGVVTGGLVGFLDDQGMGPEVTTRYSTAFALGRTILAVDVPTGDVTPAIAEQLLAKYEAADIGTYNSTKVLMDGSEVQIPQSLRVDTPAPAIIREEQLVMDLTPPRRTVTLPGDPPVEML